MKNLPIQSLNFEDIKSNLKEFLKGNETYKDFNFEASGISTLLNVLAYDTHYIGYFVKMLLDESFVDSAHTRQALLSHAKRSSYIPKNRSAAIAELVLTITTTLALEPQSRVMEVVRGDRFNSVNDTQDKRIFNVLDGVTITNRTVNGANVTYTSEPLRAYEGTLRTWNFLADTSVLNQRFVIRDANVDIDTIRVRLRENAQSTDYIDYTLASDVSDLDPQSRSFFVSTDESGYYQIFFGGGVFGLQPETGNAIEVTYISTNGESGNGARVFTFMPKTPSASTYTVTTSSVSSGGSEPQTIEELRFAIPNHTRRQKRILTEGDARTFLLDKFRNIDSINVWGGETNLHRDYGKLFVSIKPKFADSLTSLARTKIREEIIKRGFVVIDVVFLDPDFINTDLTLVLNLDLRKTTKTKAEIVSEVRARVQQYNSSNLSKFGNVLSDIEMLNFVRGGDDAIKSIYSRKVLSKMYSHLHASTSSNDIFFGNALLPNTVFSSNITYGLTTVIIKDDGVGGLNLHNAAGAIIVRSIGKVNYSTGVVTYTLPTNARIEGYETTSTGRLKMTATPSEPDIHTSLNNIVRINEITID